MGIKRRNHLKLRQTATSHGDINKNEMLTFKELDDNFIFLKERDLKTLKLDGNNLVYETLGGDNFTVDMSSLGGGGGSSLWTENGDNIQFTTGAVGIGGVANSVYELSVVGKAYASQGFKAGSYEYGVNNAIIKSYGGSVTGSFSATLGAGNNATGTQTFAIGNQVTASGNYSFAGGSSPSSSNEVIAGGEGAFVFLEGTSEFPEVGAFSDWSVTLGGSDNIISSDSNTNSVILGGRDHVISGGSSNTAIIGGIDNKIESNADYSVILGGRDIVATEQNTAYVSKLNIGTLGAGTPVNNLGIDNNGNVVAGSSNYPTVGTYLSNRVTRWDTTTNRLTTSIIRDNGTTLGVNQDPTSWVKFYIKSTSSDEGVGIYSVKTGSVLNSNVSAVRGYTTVSTLNSNQKIVAGIYGNSTLATSPTNGNYVGGYFRHGDHIDDVTGTGKDASGVFVSVDTKFSMQNIYGIKVDRMHITRSISGSVYGLRINAFSGVGTVSGGKYGIYQDGTVETNRFNGATTIDNDLTVTTLSSATNLAADSNGKLISVPSDSNLKENVTSVDSGVLDKIKQINTYKFNFVKELNMGDGEHYGHIAQEVQQIYPELVTPRAGDEEHLSLNYIEMVPLLLQAIKEQQSIIDELKNEVEVLKNK